MAATPQQQSQSQSQSQWDFTSDLEVDFGSEVNASIVYATLAVDKELQPDKVKRIMTVSDGKLLVHFEATEARFLRASFSAFVDVLTLATKTIEEFGQEMELEFLGLVFHNERDKSILKPNVGENVKESTLLWTIL
ncbi:uncharacterized protein LOC123902933 isoform X1 [Trifolium pratense]|uniref:uncharacterized protein LOC123902933 isoform X1 n=2 Tax=Trifolium pratense TaxID=57577 RepID=UPI001E694610|nr:uncharacterized protein LOC123902933 isoform X1 [Trifolium pratense]